VKEEVIGRGSEEGRRREVRVEGPEGLDLCGGPIYIIRYIKDKTGDARC
jgi:hypothetical protein